MMFGDNVINDCDNAMTNGCPAIPIDGGLSSSHSQGEVSATAAMRRRREEEAAQEVV